MAPVVLFVYNRPAHTSKTLEALKNNVGSSDILLYIYLDGLKQNATEAQKQNHAKVREIIHTQNWCKDVIINESETNLGLASSIIHGVTEVVNKHGKVIVLEDDIVTSSTFLSFMNHCLTHFENEESVCCISGYSYPIGQIDEDAFFIKGADCWGWATWSRAWKNLDLNAESLLTKIQEKELEFDFNFENNYPYLEMLKQQIENKTNSWAICWYASTYLKDMLTLYPSKTLVHNIGMDGSGTHSGSLDLWGNQAYDFIPQEYPKSIIENKKGRQLIAQHFNLVREKSLKKDAQVSILIRLLNKIRRLFK